MFGLKRISRSVSVWKPSMLYIVTKHACINAGAIGLLREVSLNKYVLCLKQMMIMVCGFCKCSLHCLELVSRKILVVQMNYFILDTKVAGRDCLTELETVF